MNDRVIRPMGFGRPGMGFGHHGFHHHGFHHGFGFPLLGFGTGLLAGALINRPYGYPVYPYGYPYYPPYYGYGY